MKAYEIASLEEYDRGIDYLLDQYNAGEFVIWTDPKIGIRYFARESEVPDDIYHQLCIKN